MTHYKTELELNSLEAPDELQMSTVTQKQQTEGNKDQAGNINRDTKNSKPNTNKNNRMSKVVCLPCGMCGNTNHLTTKVTMEPMQPAGRFYGRANRQYRTELINRTNRAKKLRMSRLRPKPRAESAMSSLRICM